MIAGSGSTGAVEEAALGAAFALGGAEAAGFDRDVDAEVAGGGGAVISTLRNAAASSSSSESEYSGSG